MKSVFVSCLLILTSTVSFADTKSYTASVSQLASNIGSKVTIQAQSSKGSKLSGSYTQTYSYNNGITNSSKNNTFVGSTSLNIISQFNDTVFTFNK